VPDGVADRGEAFAVFVVDAESTADDEVALTAVFTADRDPAGATHPDVELGGVCHAFAIRVEPDVVAFDLRWTGRRSLFFETRPDQVDHRGRVRFAGEDVAAEVAGGGCRAGAANVGADLVVGGGNFIKEFE